jgi:hypothetical protein
MKISEFSFNNLAKAVCRDSGYTSIKGYEFSMKKHHTKLVVNLALTISDFLLDSWNY